MADQKKHDDGRGIPEQAKGDTVEPPRHDSRLIPGGSLTAARTPIGMIAFEHDDLPGQAQGRKTDA